MGPLEAAKPWSRTGLEGARKFLDRVFRLVTSEEYTKKFVTEYDKTLEKVYHQTVMKVTNNYENLCFNTAISQIMIFVNEAYKADKIYIGFIEGLVKMLSPIVPHLGEELWQILGHNTSLAYEEWPKYNVELTRDSEVTYAVSVNGKLRDKLVIDADTPNDKVEEMALALEKIKGFTDGHTVVKVIVVPKKIVNIVIK